MSEGRIRAERDGQVLTLVLDRPDRMNAFGGSMREELAVAFEAATAEHAEHALRVIVVRGEGSAFCAGGDVANLKRLKEEDDGAGLLELLARGERVVRAMRAFPGPIVAAIDGPAVGAGLTLALACDLRLCSARSRFGMAFVAIGLHPDWGGSWLLAQAVGVARAQELSMTGRLVHAEEAERIGLVHEAVAEAEFEGAVATQVRRLAAASPVALALIKGTFAELAGRSLDEAFVRERQAQHAAFASDDAAEGFAAFLEKRRPRWAGR